MLKILPIFSLSFALLFGGCAHKPKSSAHIYGGDSPQIKFLDEPEAAGGNIHTY
jgi:hypothetical protein